MKKKNKILIYIASLFILVSVIFISIVIFINFFAVRMPFLNRIEKIAKKEEKLEISEQEAKIKAKEFCNKFNIACVGEPFIEDSFPLGAVSIDWEYYRIHSFWGSSYKPFGIYVAMYDKTAVSEGLTKDPYVYKPYIFFVIGGKSKEIEFYENMAIYDFYSIKKYRGIKWPEFLPEEKALNIFNALVEKMAIPKDIVFEKLEKDERRGIWTVYLLRKKDGYWYEGDAISMSIMGPTGEFVEYTKTYRGTSIPTQVKISKEKALELAWNKLSKKVPRKIKDKVKDIYKIDKAELLIIQTNILERSSVPVKIEGSKLAWVIKYYFTGGVVYHGPDPKKSMNLFTKEERKEYETYMKEKEDMWDKMGCPEREFEVRIDAATGEFLYVSKVSPWFWKWFAR